MTMLARRVEQYIANNYPSVNRRVMTKAAGIVVGAWILSAMACSAKERTSDASDGGTAGAAGSPVDAGTDADPCAVTWTFKTIEHESQKWCHATSHYCPGPSPTPPPSYSQILTVPNCANSDCYLDIECYSTSCMPCADASCSNCLTEYP